VEWFAIVTIVADIMIGAIAWRGVRVLERGQAALEKTQAVQTAILQELTKRVERLEDKSG
jgi:hypothetical protein